MLRVVAPPPPPAPHLLRDVGKGMRGLLHELPKGLLPLAGEVRLEA